MTTQRGLQSRKDVQTLFAQGRQVAANAAERDRALGTAERAGDFLLDFDHATILFGQVIAKRNLQVMKEAQNGVLVLAQSVPQIASRMLLGFASFAHRSRRTRMHLVSFGKQSQKGSGEGGQLWWRETRLTLRASLFGGVFHRQEQSFPFGGPPQAQLFCQKGQFAQERNQTQGVLAAVTEGGRPAIMDTDSGEACQDTNGIQGSLAPALVDW